MTWRGRRLARWGLLGMATVPGLLLGVGVIGQLLGGVILSAPGIYRFTLVAGGVASLLVIVLMLQGATREYFAALRDTQRGKLPAVPGSRPRGSRIGGLGSTGARPAGGGLGALFAPRRRPAPSAPAGASGAEETDRDGSENAIAEPTRGAASRRAKPTRPGSVKPKSAGTRPGRFKSRQQ